MAFFRGEEGSVAFDNGSGSVGAIASTTAWTLDTTKDTLECTAHGDTSRKYVGSLISGSGTVDLLYTATSGDNTAEIISDVLTTEDDGTAAFNLFLDTSGTKKLSFNGIITGTSFSSTVGDISTVSVSFVTNGDITSAIRCLKDLILQSNEDLLLLLHHEIRLRLRILKNYVLRKKRKRSETYLSSKNFTEQTL